MSVADTDPESAEVRHREARPRRDQHSSSVPCRAFLGRSCQRRVRGGRGPADGSAVSYAGVSRSAALAGKREAASVAGLLNDPAWIAIRTF